MHLLLYTIISINKIILEETAEANLANLENRFSNVPLRRKTPTVCTGNCDKKNLPSSSNCDRESKTISQPGCDQRISLKVAEEVVLRSTKKEKMSGNEKNVKSNVRKEASNKTDSVLKNIPESLTLKKYGSIMICQWQDFLNYFSQLYIYLKNFLFNTALLLVAHF